MNNEKLELDFGTLVLHAELFATPVAARFMENLPYEIALTQWGNELYGPIGHDFGVYQPVPEIPAGGLAYTNRGNYLCIFFGQTPAWPVEYIGQLAGDGWKQLPEEHSLSKVSVQLKQ